jgi:hypothetical protein
VKVEAEADHCGQRRARSRRPTGTMAITTAAVQLCNPAPMIVSVGGPPIGVLLAVGYKRHELNARNFETSVDPALVAAAATQASDLTAVGLSPNACRPAIRLCGCAASPDAQSS